MELKALVVANVITLLIFIVKELWRSGRTDLKENTQAIQQNTHSIIELKSELKHLRERTDEIPGIKKDINSLGQKLRDVVQ